MAQSYIITLTAAGLGTGPFDLYSNADGFFAPFETGVERYSLLAGYLSVVVPNGATVIRVASSNFTCGNYRDITLPPPPTPVPTTSTTTTTTTVPLRTITIYGSLQAVSARSLSATVYYSINSGVTYIPVGLISNTGCNLITTLSLPVGANLRVGLNQVDGSSQYDIKYDINLVNDCTVSAIPYNYCGLTELYKTAVNSNINISLKVAVDIDGNFIYCA